MIIIECSFFLFPDSITIEDGKLLFYEAIKNDDRFIDEVDEARLNIIEDYNDYYSYDLKLLNLPYYLKGYHDNYSLDGKLDFTFLYKDPLLILNELNINNSIKQENDEYSNYQIRKEAIYKRVLEKIEDKAILLALEANRRYYYNTKVDIGILDKIEASKCNIYYEHILVFHYKSKERKNDFISILSMHSKKFITLEFEHSQRYLEFIKYYKRPNYYIPKGFIDLYYQKAFKSYLNMSNKLLYESNDKILKKIKSGLTHKDYTPYKEYLDLGIYYYRMNKYLAFYNEIPLSIKERIYLAYFTLYYNKDSGVYLSSCIDLDLLDNDSLEEKLRLLKISHSLHSLEAKAMLYTHYSGKRYYNEYKKKKYS